MENLRDYIYLDNAAAMRTDDSVIEAMLPYMRDIYAVASSQFSHQPGIMAGEALEYGRRTIAESLHVQPEEIVFTSDAAESNNLAIKGFCRRNKERGAHIVTTKVEAYSVLNSFRSLEQEGFKVSYLPVNEKGLVDLDLLSNSLTERTILVSIQAANQETGTLQNLESIANIVSEKGIAFHTDATHAYCKVPLDFSTLRVTMATLQSNMIHGPKGVAALFIRKGTQLAKQIDGGFNEFDLRAGVENIPGIVGFAKAVELFTQEKRDYLRKLDSYLLENLLRIEESDLNGDKTSRVPGMVNVSFYRAEGESVILHLDMKGIGVITGSACFSRSLEPSYVLMAMGQTHERAHGSIRYTLSRYNTIQQMDQVIASTKEVVERLRIMSPLKKVVRPV